MMPLKIFNVMQKLENQIDGGFYLDIFRGYTAINKQGVEKIISELYATLPNDVNAARQYLEERNIKYKSPQNAEIYNKVKTLENYIEHAFKFAQLIVVNIKEIEHIIDNIYAEIPEEITTAQNLEKQDNM